MRDRVFLQGCVTVVAILSRSVLTAHGLFHMNEDPMRVLMLVGGGGGGLLHSGQL